MKAFLTSLAKKFISTGGGIGGWILNVALKFIWDKIAAFFKKMIYIWTEDNKSEKVNEEIKEETKNAKTTEDKQKALNKAGRFIGRNPDK